MHDVTSIELNRDCEAIQIPIGNTVMLPAGTAVDVTQTLGGSYTVRALGGLFRIGAKDADALGIESSAPKPGEQGNSPNMETLAGSADEKAIWEVLKTVYDPEIPVNIVDLGLVYDLHIEPQPSGNSKVCVKMTLTAPGCGMGPAIARDAQERILMLPGVEEAEVEIVWDPPWHQSMITADGRRTLGLE